MPKGVLYLIPVPLAEQAADRSVTPLHHRLINVLKAYIVENEKTARHWLKAMDFTVAQSDLTLYSYGKHADKTQLSGYFKELERGEDVGLMSEAGCPAIADPGSEIVAEAHRRGIKVVPLVGPSSILLALMASGFNGQSFIFHGYLPIDKAQRTKVIRDLESNSVRLNQTQIFIETPFRNNQMLDELLRTCKPQTRLCVAWNLTGEDEHIVSDTIAGWKHKKADLHKQAAIFLLYR